MRILASIGTDEGESEPISSVTAGSINHVGSVKSHAAIVSGGSVRTAKHRATPLFDRSKRTMPPEEIEAELRICL